MGQPFRLYVLRFTLNHTLLHFRFRVVDPCYSQFPGDLCPYYCSQYRSDKYLTITQRTKCHKAIYNFTCTLILPFVCFTIFCEVFTNFKTIRRGIHRSIKTKGNKLKSAHPLRNKLQSGLWGVSKNIMKRVWMLSEIYKKVCSTSAERTEEFLKRKSIKGSIDHSVKRSWLYFSIDIRRIKNIQSFRNFSGRQWRVIDFYTGSCDATAGVHFS